MPDDNGDEINIGSQLRKYQKEIAKIEEKIKKLEGAKQPVPEFYYREIERLERMADMIHDM